MNCIHETYLIIHMEWTFFFPLKAIQQQTGIFSPLWVQPSGWGPEPRDIKARERNQETCWGISKFPLGSASSWDTCLMPKQKLYNLIQCMKNMVGNILKINDH